MSSLSGILILTRHGDRQGFYQSPIDYSAKRTNLTVLGYVQEYQNGQDLRSRYLTGEGAIQGIEADISQPLQIQVEADGGGEGGVIVESANALLQGLFPPYNDTLLLANGSTVSWDQGRSQLISIQSIEPDQEVYFEGWTGCKSWSKRLDDWYKSEPFNQLSSQSKPFFDSIQTLTGPNRPSNLENAWNIFDYLNVEYIHNSTLSPKIGQNNVEQASYWAQVHESFAFSSDDRSDIGNIAGRAMLNPILSSLGSISNSSNPLKISYLAASYKPFTSLFSMLDLEDLKGKVVSYASTMVFEVYSDQTLQLRFRNGTQGDLSVLKVLNSTQDRIPLSQFTKELQPYSIDTLAQWCDVCSTTDSRGCQTLAALNGTGHAGYSSITSTTGRHRVSPVVAGVIGSMVTLAVASLLLAIWVFFTSRPTASRRTKRLASNKLGSAQDRDELGLVDRESFQSRSSSNPQKPS
ncbi:phosphoglycerate mutase-like protein [Violaceomyces palustris]|uniref:Phosphoglycerate mutase-like protein n=1 Tax=Violaceomyces palustris TaxID=1673888 RepID=A0ACD0NZM2_9BASI|nr:phosphoglycerate mutase-like protein [Violaceomyces palustris]